MISCKKSVGERIRDARKDKKMSQEDLAEAMNVSRQTISNWENGVALPPVGKLDMLSRQLDIPLTWLLDGGMANELLPEKAPAEIAATTEAPPATETVRTKWWGEKITLLAICALAACLLLVVATVCIGFHRMEQKIDRLTPEDTAVPMEELEGEEEDNFSMLEPGFLQSLQP